MNSTTKKIVSTLGNKRIEERNLVRKYTYEGNKAKLLLMVSESSNYLPSTKIIALESLENMI